MQERWYEKLHDWDKALTVYQEKSKAAPEDPDLVLGRMRCMEALGEWGDLHDTAREHWEVSEEWNFIGDSMTSFHIGPGRK